MTRIDPGLLKPVHDDEDRLSRWEILAVVVAGLAVVGVIGWVWWQATGRETNPETIDFVEPFEAVVRLEALEAEQPVVFWPTVVPAGWEVCSQSADPAAPDRICDPEGEGWMQLSLRFGEAVGGRPSGPVRGSSLLADGDRVVVEVALGNSTLKVVSNDLPIGTLGDIVRSIPLAGHPDAFKPIEEARIDLFGVNEQDVRTMLLGTAGSLRISWGDAGFTATGEHARLGVYDEYWLPPEISEPKTLDRRVFAVEYPQLFDLGRPVIIGQSPHFGFGQSRAMWDQGGYSWSLESARTVDDMKVYVMEVIAAIGGFST